MEPNHVPELTPQLDLAAKAVETPQYKYLRIYPNEGSSNLSITSSGGAQREWDCPNDVINWSRTALTWTQTFTAVASSYHQVYTHLGQIREITLSTRSGTRVVDLRDVGYVHNALRWFLRSVSKDLNSGAVATVGQSNVIGETVRDGMNIINFTATTDWNAISKTTSSLHFLSSTPDTTNTPVPANEPHAFGGPATMVVGGTAVNQASAFSVFIPLREILGPSFFLLDKDVYFGQIMVLRLIFNDYTHFGFVNRSIFNPAGTASSIANTITLSSIQLQLCVEKNENLRNAVIERTLKQGVSMLIPHTINFGPVSSSGTSNTAIYRFNRTSFKALKLLFCTAANNTVTVAGQYDIATTSSFGMTDKIQSWYFTLNGQRMTEYDLTPSLAYRDMRMNDELLDTLVSYRGYQNYAQFFSAVLNFTGKGSLAHLDWSRDDGLSLSSDVEIGFITTQASGNWLYSCYAVGSRVLNIGPSGVSVY